MTFSGRALSGMSLANLERAHLTTTADARLAYRVLLGRGGESSEALRGKAGRPVAALIALFVGSQEFIDHVAGPIAEGTGWRERFPGAPSAYERRWAAARLVREPHAVAALKGARSWCELYQGLLLDEAFTAAIQTAVGSDAAVAFAEGLALEALRLTLDRGHDQLQDAGPGPVISFLAPAPPFEALTLLTAATYFLDQDYPRWELAVAAVSPPAATALLLETLQAFDPRVRIDAWMDAAAASSSVAASFDLCSGDYVAVLAADVRLDPGAVRAIARAAQTCGRPDLIELNPEFLGEPGGAASSCLLVRTDVAARLQLFEAGARPADAELKARVLSQGGRLEIAAPEGDQPTSHGGREPYED